MNALFRHVGIVPERDNKQCATSFIFAGMDYIMCMRRYLKENPTSNWLNILKSHKLSIQIFFNVIDIDKQ